MGRLGTLRRDWVALSRHQGRGIHRRRPSGDQGELPGADPDRDIDVSVENGVLTIAAERQESNREKLEKGYRSEFRYGSFVRQVRLPAGTSAEVVSAAYKDGVLKIRMPKPTPKAASRRIQIQRG